MKKERNYLQKIKIKANLRKFNFWLNEGYRLLRILRCNKELKAIIVIVENNCVLG